SMTDAPVPPSSYNASPPPALSTLSLHDALPICGHAFEALIHPEKDAHPGNNRATAWVEVTGGPRLLLISRHPDDPIALALAGQRSEEHTSELQSRENLVCRLLLEKKKKEYTRS